MKKIDKIVKEMIEHANNAGTEVQEENLLEKYLGSWVPKKEVKKV